jgi:uncharacterized membrane protein
MSTQNAAKPASVVRPGIVIGIGLGGFFDGIVLHQVLQWHHMLTSAGYPPDSVENFQLNTLWDGFFHIATYLFVVAGLFYLWRTLRRGAAVPSYRVLIGAMLVGWGIFNLVEGIIDHHILGIHHVRSGPDQALYDIGFLIWGALMLMGGWLLTRRSSAATDMDA